MFKNPLEIVMGLIKKNQPSKQKTYVRIHVASTHMIQSFNDQKDRFKYSLYTTAQNDCIYTCTKCIYLFKKSIIFHKFFFEITN